MIQEDYCSFEVAKLLKEKGFDGDCGDCECHMFYHEMIDRIMPIMTIGMIPDYDTVYFAPTHQMAMKWLREVYNKHICIGYDIYLKFFFQIMDLKETVEYDYVETKYYHAENEIEFQTYEEAVEEAIKYSLENLI